MQVLPVLTLCLVGTVVLCAAQSTTNPTSSPASVQTSDNPSQTGSPTGTTVRPTTAGSPVPSASSPVPSASSPVPSASSPVPSTGSPVPSTGSPVPSTGSPVPTNTAAEKTTPTMNVDGSSNELSSGAIAGIVIGSIAGVGVVGGGVFGLLKYTGKI